VNLSTKLQQQVIMIPDNSKGRNSPRGFETEGSQRRTNNF